VHRLRCLRESGCAPVQPQSAQKQCQASPQAKHLSSRDTGHNSRPHTSASLSRTHIPRGTAAARCCHAGQPGHTKNCPLALHRLCTRPACIRACTASKGDCAAGSHTKSCCWGSLYGQKGDVPDSTHNWTIEQLHNGIQHALQGSMPHDHTSPCLQSAHLVACERPLTTASDGGSNDLCNNQQPLLL
jgi:hypothetical protein